MLPVLPANFYGSWLLPPFDEKDARIQIRLVFYNNADSNKSSVRQVISCSKGNNSLIAEAESAITVGKDQITILDPLPTRNGTDLSSARQPWPPERCIMCFRQMAKL
jgi:hypothetical protein